MKNEPAVAREWIERDGKRLAPLSRSANLAREGGKTAVWFSVSSEEPCADVVYLNGQWQRAMVVLPHQSGTVNMARVKDGIALRDKHGGDQVAMLKNPTLRGGKLGGTEIAWSCSERAQILRADYENEVRRDCSVEGDYDPADLVQTGEIEGVPLVRVARWTPLAAALGVVVPADPTVGLNRELAGGSQGQADGQGKNQTPESPTADPVVDVPVVTREIKTMSDKTMSGADAAEIAAMCRQYDVPAEKQGEFLREAVSVASVREQILRDFAQKKEVKPQVAAEMKPIARDADRKFSILRAIQHQAGMKVDAGFELEMSQEAARVTGKAARGLLIPWDAKVERTFITTSNGSNIIAQNLRPDLFIDFLYAKMVLPQLGVQMLPGLVGDILLPKQSGAITNGWVDETTAVSSSDPAIIQVKGTPKTAGAYTDISRQMLLQTTPAAETIVQNSLFESLARTIQLGALEGTGANNQPTGLKVALASGYQNQAAVAEASVGTTGAPTFAEIETMKALPEESNVDGEMKWCMRPTAFRKLKATARGTTIYVPVAMEDKGDKFVADTPCFTTSATTAGYAYYGRWDTMAIGLWGATDLIVDPYSLSTSGKLRLVALQSVDVMHRYLVGFAWSSKFGS
jgi:HK97 family phage major capsid protein